MLNHNRGAASLVYIILVIAVAVVIAVFVHLFTKMSASSESLSASIKAMTEDNERRHEALRASHPLGAARLIGESNHRCVVVRYDGVSIVGLLDSGASVTVDPGVLKPVHDGKPESAAAAADRKPSLQ